MSDYSTFSRKIIYIISVKNIKNNWNAYNNSVKVGDASVKDLEIDLRPNSDDLRKAADRRVKQFMKTARVPYNIDWAEYAYRRDISPHWFRDYNVHNVLENSGIKKNPNLSGDGGEWYMADDKIVKDAILSVKDGKSAIDSTKVNKSNPKIVLRPEQKRAVKQSKYLKNIIKCYGMLKCVLEKH